MDFPWSSRGLPVVFPCSFRGLPVVFPWSSRALPDMFPTGVPGAFRTVSFFPNYFQNGSLTTLRQVLDNVSDSSRSFRRTQPGNCRRRTGNYPGTLRDSREDFAVTVKRAPEPSRNRSRTLRDSVGDFALTVRKPSETYREPPRNSTGLDLGLCGIRQKST